MDVLGQSLGIPFVPFANLPSLSADQRAIVWCQDHPFGAGFYGWDGALWEPLLTSSFDSSYSFTGFRPANGTSYVTYGNLGLNVTSPTAATTPAISSTNSIAKKDRVIISTNTTAGSIAYMRPNFVYAKAGSIPDTGGYRYKAGFGLTQLQAGMRAQVGLLGSASNPTNVDPLTQALAKIAIGVNNNTGNLQLMTSNGGAPTVVDLGADFPVNITTWYEWSLTCVPNANSISSVITNTETGQQDTRTLAATLPPQATQLAPISWVTNNGTAAIASMAVGRWNLEFK